MNEEPLQSAELKDLENGIFNLVVTLAKSAELSSGDPKRARQYVISYLERLISGLKLLDNDPGEQADD